MSLFEVLRKCCGREPKASFRYFLLIFLLGLYAKCLLFFSFGRIYVCSLCAFTKMALHQNDDMHTFGHIKIFGSEAIKMSCLHDHSCKDHNCSSDGSLYKHIDLSKVSALNEATPGSVKSVLLSLGTSFRFF